MKPIGTIYEQIRVGNWVTFNEKVEPRWEIYLFKVLVVKGDKISIISYGVEYDGLPIVSFITYLSFIKKFPNSNKNFILT